MLASPQVFAQHTPSLTLLTDTVVLDVRSVATPLCHLSLQGAILHRGQLYCRFRECKPTNTGWANQYFYIINPSTGQSRHDKCQYHYDYDGFFAPADSGVVFLNIDDSVWATSSPSGWNYLSFNSHPNLHANVPRDLYPETIFHDSTYLVDFLDMGEWGCYTWICHLPTHKHLLYNMPLGSPVNIADTLYLKNKSGIYRLDPALIALAQKGFCSAEKCRSEKEWWLLDQFYASTRRMTNKKLDAHLARFAKKNFTDTICHQLSITRYPVWPWEECGDTSILRLFSLHGHLAALVNIRHQLQVSLVEGSNLAPVCHLGTHVNAHANAALIQPYDSFTLLFNDDRFLSNVLHFHRDTLRIITLIQDQDTLPWSPRPSFDTMLSLIRHHALSVTPDIIHQQETAHGSASDRMQWDLSESGTLFRHYCQPLTTPFQIETSYYFLSDGTLSSVWWDFNQRHDLDLVHSILDTSFHNMQQTFFSQIQDEITHQLGQPIPISDEKLQWTFPEGTYTFVRKDRFCRLSFKRQAAPPDTPAESPMDY